MVLSLPHKKRLPTLRLRLIGSSIFGEISYPQGAIAAQGAHRLVLRSPLLLAVLGGHLGLNFTAAIEASFLRSSAGLRRS